MKTLRYQSIHPTAAHLVTLAVTFFVVTPLAAEVPLSEAFAACETSVLEGTDTQLREIGSFIDENERNSSIRVDTPEGTVLATFLPPTGSVSACVLWGRVPSLENEFKGEWQDWVEWDEAAGASETWFTEAMNIPGSVDLTDHSQPGYVVARCDALDHGLILASQPALANAWRQVLPEPEVERQPLDIYYQFSVVTALPGRCSAAVAARE